MRANFRTLPIVALALGLAFGLPVVAVAEDDPAARPPAGIRDYHLRAIKETGVSADGKGALQLLRALMPNKDKEQEVAELIAGLSADGFAQREAAELGLLRVGLDALPALQKAHESREVETAARAGRVIARIKRNREVLAPAIVGAFALIGRDRPPGGVAAILDVLPMLNDAWAESQGCDLLPIIATAADRQPLEAVLKRGGPELTLIAAIQALAVIYKTAELAGLEPYMAATRPEAVQLATAHALANRGHRPVLAVVVRLLESEDGTTRWKAFNLIKALSGEEFEGKPYVEKLPAKSLEPIKKWLREKAPTAELHFPLKEVALKEISGYLAASCGAGVIVFDAAGKPVRRIACSPYDAQALPGNEVLVCERENDRVIIFDAAGKARRIAENFSSPTDAELVSNGNLLVLENDIGRILEIDAGGKHVWSIGGLNNPYDLDRLPNGNTLVADSGNGRLVEFDQEGDIVWQKGGLDFPNSVLRLEDGRTLYTTYLSGGVAMLDLAGETLWERVFDGATLFSIAISAGRIHVSDGGSQRILILGMDGANSGTVNLDADFVDVGFVRE